MDSTLARRHGASLTVIRGTTGFGGAWSTMQDQVPSEDGAVN
jgi:hypothetical protein